MPRMYCQRCGKDMGNHKYHDKGTCKECRMDLGHIKAKNRERRLKNDINVNENSRTWKVIG